MQPAKQPPEPVTEREAEPAAVPEADLDIEREAEPAASDTEPATVRSSRTPRDMALSLAVLLAMVFLMVGAYRVLYRGEEPVSVDTTAAVEQARTAGLVARAPGGLPTDWRATSALFRREEGGSTLRIGYAVPGGGGLQLIRSDVPADALLARELGDAPRLTGAVTVGPNTWQRYAARRSEVALVRTGAAGTTVVIGWASDEQLRALAVAAAEAEGRTG